MPIRRVPLSLRGTKLGCWWRDPITRDWCEKDAKRGVGEPTRWFCKEHAKEFKRGVVTNEHAEDQT